MNKQTEALKMAIEALNRNKKTHHYCEDTWYSCPKHEEGCADDREGEDCNCGADRINAEFDKAIQACKEALEQPIIRDWKETIDERIAKDDEFKKALEQPAQEQILKSLRDEFAMAALQGMISTAGAPCLGGLDGFEKHAAKAAYKMADAMIKTRELKDE